MSDFAPNLDVNDPRTWRAHWDQVGPMLEKIKRRELRAMTEEEHLQALVDVLDFELPDDGRKRVCGLAEFYRRWRKA